MLKRWIKRILAVLGLLALAFAGYITWQLGHPWMPADTRILASKPVPKGTLTARYFGATTLVFDDGEHAVMVDALLSRPGLATAMFGKVESLPDRIDPLLRRASLAKLDLLLVTHSHYDHALDIAAVAARTGARIVGSESTRQVALGGGIADDRITTIRGGERITTGDFIVTALRSIHSPDDRVPGDIAAPVHQPASIKDYREGGTFAYLIEHRGLRIVVHASANAVPGMYRGVKADVIFLATGGLHAQPPEFTERYWTETVAATGAKLVVPVHWDDFLRPLGEPLLPLPRLLDNIPATMARLAPLAARDRVRIRYLPAIDPVDLAAAVKGD